MEHAESTVESVDLMEKKGDSFRKSSSGASLHGVPTFLRDCLCDPVFRTEVSRFCLVGILNTIVGYGAFYILVNHLYYLLALLVSHVIGVIHSYLWNKFWIFKTKKISLLEFLRFNIVYIIVFMVNACALFICVDIISADPKLAQLLLLPAITVVSFAGQKIWTFGSER